MEILMTPIKAMKKLLKEHDKDASKDSENRTMNDDDDQSFISVLRT
jgi:hypothetical protein